MATRLSVLSYLTAAALVAGLTLSLAPAPANADEPGMRPRRVYHAPPRVRTVVHTRVVYVPQPVPVAVPSCGGCVQPVACCAPAAPAYYYGGYGYRGYAGYGGYGWRGYGYRPAVPYGWAVRYGYWRARHAGYGRRW